jgi:hypothetical protein
MKGKWLFVQLTKLQEALDGTTNEPRPVIHRLRSSKTPSPVEITGLFDDSPEKATVYQAERKADSNKGNGSK